MRLLKIKLENFRLFYGCHKIEFSTSNDLPITIVIGENGGGKTTFLNAIYWAFTGEFSPRFEGSTKLINWKAENEGVTECSVEIEFEHKGARLVIKRTATRSSRVEVGLDAIDSHGMLSRLAAGDDAQRHLSSILPKHLASWFIFDGEAVGDIDLDGSLKLKESLYQTFGFTEISRLIGDLKSLANEYAKAIAGEANDDQLRDINDDIEREERRLERYEEEIKDLSGQLESAKKNEARYTAQLSGMDQTQDLERNRAKELEQLEILQLKLKNERLRRGKTLRELAIPVTLSSRVCSIIDRLKTVSEAQDIPAPHNEILVTKILDSKECICGRPVIDGTPEHETVRGLLDTAATQAMSVRIQAINHYSVKARAEAAGYSERMQEHLRQINHFENQVQDKKESLSEIAKLLDGIDHTVVAQLRDKRRSELEAIQRISTSLGRIEGEKRESIVNLQRFSAERDQLISKRSRNSSLKKYRDKVMKLLHFSQRRFREQELEVLQALSGELSGAVDRFLTKNFTIDIIPDTYQIVVRNADGQVTTLSTGERHTITFVFIAAIVGMAAQRNSFKRVRWLSEPIVAPLVLDAPFSVQDELYRSRAARQIAEQVEQSVLMFDADKWRGGLMRELAPKVGKFYVLVSRTRGPQGDKGIKTLCLDDGRSFKLNEYDAERDDSFFMEIG